MSYKRITRELLDIKNKYNHCSLTLTDNLYIIEVKLNNKTTITFKCCSNYPFKSPNLFINTNEYRNMLCIKNKLILNELHKLNITCLCRKSFCCHGNWSPSIKLLDIIDEYKQNRDLVKKIVYRIIMYDLCLQFNIEAIEISDMISFFL